jgi:hypothetical protein
LLNNREIATIVWIVVLLIVGLLVPKTRRILVDHGGNIAKSALVPSILAVFSLFVVWYGRRFR